MNILHFFIEKKLERAIKRSLWEMGPGEPCWLVISDEEFWSEFGGSDSRLTKQDGVYCITVEAWGGRVYVTCPKLSGRSVPSDGGGNG